MATEIRTVQRSRGHLCWACQKGIKRGDKIITYPASGRLTAKYHYACWEERNRKRQEAAIAEQEAREEASR